MGYRAIKGIDSEIMGKYSSVQSVNVLYARLSDAVFIMDGIMMGCRKDLFPELIPDEPNISTNLQMFILDGIMMGRRKDLVPPLVLDEINWVENTIP